MMMMASATNGKAEAEPLTVEMGQLEKAAALCVEKPVDAISVAGDEAPAATVAGDEAPAATEASDKAPAAREDRRLTPLTKKEVERVLSWKRGKFTRNTSIFSADAIEAFEAGDNISAEYQAWMRAEYDANGGVVLVDDEFLREQDESIESLKVILAEIAMEDDDFDES